jgi:mRNA interferase MazF
MKTGDIVIIPFPFAELTDIKARPAVVITETKDKYKDLVLSAISSQLHDPTNEAEILIEPESGNGLRTMSIIKVDRIFTLKKEKLISNIGRLNMQQLDKFKYVFQSLVE